MGEQVTSLARDWDVLPFGSLAKELRRTGYAAAELLSVYLDRGVIPYSQSAGQVHKPSLDLSAYQLVKPGDLVLNNQQAWRGSVGVSAYTGIVSPAYVVCSLSSRIFPGFARYLFRAPSMVDQYVLASKGVGSIQRNLVMQQLRRAPVPLPPSSEQRLIVRYLDNAELRIARAIQAKERLAGLVAERREAVVTAYLRGNVKPGRPGLDSGIPGLGTLPADWQLLPVKSVWKSVDVRSKTGKEERLTVSARSGVVPRSTKTVTMFEAATYVGHKVVEPDQLVINSLWAWAGGLGVSEHSGVVSPVYGVYGLKDPFGMNPAFFHALLRSNLMQWQFQVLSKGIWKSRLQLSDDAFLSMRIPVPPLAEQNAIARQIAEATSTMDAALEAIAIEVGLLREYRTRLISDVVTGKKDIRADAAKMKDVDPDELASVLAGVTMTENDELGEDADAE